MFNNVQFLSFKCFFKLSYFSDKNISHSHGLAKDMHLKLLQVHCQDLLKMWIFLVILFYGWYIVLIKKEKWKRGWLLYSLPHKPLKTQTLYCLVSSALLFRVECGFGSQLRNSASYFHFCLRSERLVFQTEENKWERLDSFWKKRSFKREVFSVRNSQFDYVI